MDARTRTGRGRQFDRVAETYARTRPTYPDPAVDWLLGAPSLRVLELAAGTGKLTVSLAERGQHVVATEPSPQMITALAGGVDVPSVRCVAEQLPFTDACFDVVVVGQAFHWFDTAAAVPEIARVLAAGGTLAMIWNFRDERTDWSRQLSDIIGAENFGPAQPRGVDWLQSTELGDSGPFGPIEQRDFEFVQELDREGLLGLVSSRSYVLALGDEERKDVLDRVGRLSDATVDGAGRIALPYVTECYRTRLTIAATE